MQRVVVVVAVNVCFGIFLIGSLGVVVSGGAGTSLGFSVVAVFGSGTHADGGALRSHAALLLLCGDERGIGLRDGGPGRDGGGGRRSRGAAGGTVGAGSRVDRRCIVGGGSGAGVGGWSGRCGGQGRSAGAVGDEGDGGGAGGSGRRDGGGGGGGARGRRSGHGAVLGVVRRCLRPGHGAGVGAGADEGSTVDRSKENTMLKLCSAGERIAKQGGRREGSPKHKLKIDVRASGTDARQSVTLWGAAPF